MIQKKLKTEGLLKMNKIQDIRRKLNMYVSELHLENN